MLSKTIAGDRDLGQIAPAADCPKDHTSADDAKWEEFAKVASWRRDDYLKKAGLATIPGDAAPNSSVANACAGLLSKLLDARGSRSLSVNGRASCQMANPAAINPNAIDAPQHHDWILRTLALVDRGVIGGGRACRVRQVRK